MALTRTEIELLINARNNAKAAFDQLKGQMDGIAGSTDKASQSQEGFSQHTQASGLAAGAASVAVGMLADRVARGLVSAFNDSIQAANQLDAGLIGVSAQANAMGLSADTAKQAAKELAQDGLMTVSEAATGLKNLMAKGLDIPQAIAVMKQLKDSAAFGRQGMLEFGQAVVGATEGIKNGISATSDNAGVTTNLSIIYQKAGMSADALSNKFKDYAEAQKFVNQFGKETHAQLGNTAKLLDTAAGKQAQFNSQVTIAYQQIGKALQPALTSVLSALTPFVQAVGASANVLVPLAAAAAAVVIPLAAMKAMALLGIPSLASLGATALTMAVNFEAATLAAGSLRGGMNLMATQAGITTASLGLLNTAGLLVGAAFIGWQIGRVIAELTGLDSVVEHATASLMGYNAALKDQTAGAVQDVKNRAIRDGAKATISYSEAIEYNTNIAKINIAAHSKSLDAQKAGIEAQLALGRITKETANAELLHIAGTQQAADVAAKRLTLTSALTVAEANYNKEIKATGYTQAELVTQLKKNETGFMAWAKQVDLSQDTIKRLKDQLTESNKVHTKAAEAAKKHADALAEIQSAGEGWKGTLAGIDTVTAQTVKGYLAAGVSASALALEYKLTDAQVKALTKSLEEEKQTHDKLAAAQKKHADAMAEIASVGDSWKGTLAKMDAGMITAIQGYLDAGVSQAALAEAYGLTDAQINAVSKSLQDQKKILDITTRSTQETADLMEQYYGLISARAGSSADEQIAAIERWKQKEIGQLKASDQNWQAHYDAIVKVADEKTSQVTNATRIELSRQARDAEVHYKDLLAIFGPYAANVVDAHKKMVEAQMAEAGKLPTYWQTNVLPGITSAIRGIESSVASSFAAMLTGAKGFGDGMKGVWQDIKKSVTDILADILDQFIHSFLKGMLGAMMGQKGAFSSAFAGLFGGGGGVEGGLLNLLGLGGAAGGAGAAGVTAQIGATAAGIDALAVGGGAAAAGGTAGGAAGGAGAAGASSGLMAGLAGGAGAAGGGLLLGMLGKKLFGGGGAKASAFGAGTGFASGALIGSIVPGLGTLVGGAIGALAGALSGWFGKGSGRKEIEAFANSSEIGGFDALQAKLVKMGDAGAALWVKLTQGVGKNDAKGAKKAIEDVREALDNYEKQQLDANKATEAAALADAEATAASKGRTDALTKQMDALKAQAQGLDQELADLNASEAPEEFMGKVESMTRARIAADQEVLNKKLAGIAQELQAELDAEEERRRKAQEPVTTPRYYTYPNGDGPTGSGEAPEPGDSGGGGGGRPEGGAAGGVMANRPGLVIFGEGGETEVGGPASFFQRIFESLGVGTKGGGGGVTIAPVFNIYGVAGDIRQTISRDVLPVLVDLVRTNDRGALTDLQEVLVGG